MEINHHKDGVRLTGRASKGVDSERLTCQCSRPLTIYLTKATWVGVGVQDKVSTLAVLELAL